MRYFCLLRILYCVYWTKTIVKMSPVNPPTATTIQRWIQDIPELQYDGAGQLLFCRACDSSFFCAKRSHVSQHSISKKHKTNTGLQTQTHFNRDLMEVMVACSIPWNQLSNPMFRQFLHNCTSGKYSNVSVPSESTLRKNYLPAEHNRVKESVLMKIGNNNIWMSVNDTTDAFGRTLTCVAVGALNETTPTQTHIIACKQLHKTNAGAVTLLIHSCLRELWGDKYEESLGNLLLFITDDEPYMEQTGKLLKEIYKNMLHLTCLAHALNRLAEAVSELFPEVNRLISNMKKEETVFSQMLPHIPPPPEPVMTRWGTWLEAASYYYCYFNDIKRVIEQLNNETRSISKVEQTYTVPDILKDLSYIHANFSRIPLAIKELEKSTPSAVEAMNVVFDLRNYLFQCSGSVAEEIKVKFEAILNTNPGFRTMCCVIDLLNGKELDSLPEVNVASLEHYKYFKHAPVISVAVERTFSKIKWILTDKRRRLAIDHLESLLIIHCNKCETECEVKCEVKDFDDK